MELFAFSALLARMKYIDRWSLMHSSRRESLSEHTLDTALLAHCLCLISTQIFDRNYTEVIPEDVVMAALYHDAPEILTGDLPTPVKYHSSSFRQAYQVLEEESKAEMLKLLPRPLQKPVGIYLRGERLSDCEKTLLKAADRLSALIKCIEESQTGNREFDAAMNQLRGELHAMNCPEAEYFMQYMLPCFTMNLDELTHLE